jgi:hypothetical protein
LRQCTEPVVEESNDEHEVIAPHSPEKERGARNEAQCSAGQWWRA